MAQPNAIYQRHSDEVARLASITIQTGTDPGDENYGPAALVDDNPARLAKIDDVDGAWELAYESKQPAELCALIHGSFDAGADVRIEASNDGNWANPLMSGAFTIPAWLGSGVNAWPVNPWLDLTALDGYDADGFFYYRLICEGNSQNIQLGQLWLGRTIRYFDPDVQWNYVKSTRKRIIDHQTAFGVSTIYSRRTNEWRFDASHRMDESLYEAMEAHWMDVDGRSYPWLLIPDGEVNRCFLVRNTGSDNPVEHFFLDIRDRKFSVEEVSRGLRPGVAVE